MATPRRIFQIYHLVGQQAERIRKEQLANGGPLSSTVKLLCERDAGKLLSRWGEEMQELCGVIDGSHQDPYILEATQVFYWASLYAIAKGADWEQLDFDRQRAMAADAGYATVADLLTEVDRMVKSGPDQAIPAHLFKLWNAAEHLQRRLRPSEAHPTLAEVMDYDLDEMSQRAYLQPFLQRVTD